MFPDPAVAPVIPPVTVPTVHAKLLATDAVSEILGLVPLQMATEAGLVTTGVGLTVTVIVYGIPTQAPVTEVGVTMYSTLPAVVLLGLVNVWLIRLPLPADAPVMLPLIVPIVHVNVLGAVAASVIFGLALLHTETVAGLLTAGLGFTVTVIVNAGPAHEPVVDVGVTIYSTLPAVELLGLVSVWLIVLPEPALAPVIPPLIDPMVHVKLDGTLAVSAMFGPVPVQIEVAAAFVTAGVGFTVTVIV